MSSELYLRVEVPSQSELHRRLVKQLEIERKQQEELVKEILGKVEQAKSQLRNTKEQIKDSLGKNNSSPTKVKISNVTDYEEEESETSNLKHRDSTVRNNNMKYEVEKKKLTSIDLSHYLTSGVIGESDADKKSKYAKEINNKLQGVVGISQEQIIEKNKFVAYLNSLLSDSELDYEYFKNLIDRRLNQMKSVIEIKDHSDWSEEKFQYYALCELLGISIENLDENQLVGKIHMLTKRLIEKRKDQYVEEALKEVFSKLDMVIEEEFELEGLWGNKVIMPEVSNCSVFMSNDGTGILFETIAEAEGNSEISHNQKALIEESAVKICSKYKEVIELMRKKGIIIHVECEVKPNINKIRKINTKNKVKVTKRKNKEKYMGG